MSLLLITSPCVWEYWTLIYSTCWSSMSTGCYCPVQDVGTHESGFLLSLWPHTHQYRRRNPSCKSILERTEMLLSTKRSCWVCSGWHVLYCDMLAQSVCVMFGNKSIDIVMYLKGRMSRTFISEITNAKGIQMREDARERSFLYVSHGVRGWRALSHNKH